MWLAKMSLDLLGGEAEFAAQTTEGRLNTIVNCLDKKLGETWRDGDGINSSKMLVRKLCQGNGTFLCCLTGVSPPMLAAGSSDIDLLSDNIRSFFQECEKVNIFTGDIRLPKDLRDASNQECESFANYVYQFCMNKLNINVPLSPVTHSSKRSQATQITANGYDFGFENKSSTANQSPVVTLGCPSSAKIMPVRRRSSMMQSDVKAILGAAGDSPTKGLLALLNHGSSSPIQKGGIGSDSSTLMSQLKANKQTSSPSDFRGRNSTEYCDRSRLIDEATVSANASLEKVRERIFSNKEKLLKSANNRRDSTDILIQEQSISTCNSSGSLSPTKAIISRAQSLANVYESLTSGTVDDNAMKRLGHEISALQELCKIQFGREDMNTSPVKTSIEELAYKQERMELDEEVSQSSLLSLTQKVSVAHSQAIETDEQSKVIAKDKEISTLQSRLASVCTQYKDLQQSLDNLKFEYADLSNDIRVQLSSGSTLCEEVISRLRQKIVKTDSEQKEIKRRFLKETKRRKELLNIVHNLKGNIRVMCRIRPVLESDLEKDDSNVAVEALSDDRVIISTERQSATGRGSVLKTDEFEFDCIFGPTSTQKSVFEEVQPLVESVMDGFHSCVFAYGQTGSGKTYTMSGSGQANRGINYLALEELFRIHEQREAATNFKYDFTVKNVEIYCEKIIDLLASEGANAAEKSSNDKPQYLEIKFSERDGVTMPGCVEIPVSSAEDINRVMALGELNRSSANTKMNVESSRSHSVVIISVRGENIESGTISSGQLVLVDLAGSERLTKSCAKGTQLKEAQSINKSLSCLGDVIAALESKAGHIPFRNSKLTTLLQESLGKDNKALMILHVSPTTYNTQESLCSLKFAARVRCCELGRAKKKESGGDYIKLRAQARAAQNRVSALELESRKLTKQLESVNQTHKSEKKDSSAETERLYEKVRKLEEKNSNLIRSFEIESKSLKEKLNVRDQKDNEKTNILEDQLHDAKLEIANLRQQLKSASLSHLNFSSENCSTQHQATVDEESLISKKPAASRRRSVAFESQQATGRGKRPLPSVEIERSKKSTSDYYRSSEINSMGRRVHNIVLKEHSASLINIENVETPLKPDFEGRMASKQVSWKETPEIIPRSEEKPIRGHKDQENGIGENYISSTRRGNASVAMPNVAAARPRRNRNMGGASRVLQTPAHRGNQQRAAARRIPTIAQRSRS